MWTTLLSETNGREENWPQRASVTSDSLKYGPS